MIGKIILMVFVIGVMIFAGYFFYQNIPGEPELFNITTNRTRIEVNSSIGETPLFVKNIRFNHNSLSYSISSTCSEERRNKMSEAFIIVSNKTQKLSFHETDSDTPDILVVCSIEEIQQEKDMFIAGHGGPTEIVNTGLYNVILKGDIKLYQESRCDYPVVEVHELLHVLGFDHSEDPDNIMYNTSNCDQQISVDVIETLNNLYSIIPFADLYIDDISAIKRGRYLDFNISVKNQGLLDSGDFILTLGSGGEEIRNFSLKDIQVGGGRIIQITNLKMPSRATDKLEFIVDKQNVVRELDESNNKIELAVSG